MHTARVGAEDNYFVYGGSTLVTTNVGRGRAAPPARTRQTRYKGLRRTRMHGLTITLPLGADLTILLESRGERAASGLPVAKPIRHFAGG
eukprot:34093-Prymnesium_polylepis.1